MNKFIQELKEDHVAIATMLINLKKLGATSEEGKKLLIDSKTSLLAHLTKEDERLYPPLFERAKTDDDLQKILDVSGKEMDAITKFIINFYDKYEKDSSNSVEFDKDVTTFLTTLKTRIMKEEVGIYKAYENFEIES